MTFTRTITLPPTPTLVLPPRPPSPQELFAFFVKRLGDMPVASAELSMKIQVWCEKFAGTTEPLKISLALCSFLCNIGLPECEDEIRAILKLTTSSPDQFIKAYKQMLRKKEVYFKKLQILSETFQSAIQDLCHLANDSILHSKEIFLAIKQELEELNAMQVAVSNEMKERVRSLKDKVDQVTDALDRGTQDVAAIGREMEEEQILLANLVKECKEVLQQI